jgi:hypothetical protein
MDPTKGPRPTDEPLVEPAPDDAVIPALIQSAHPVEFIESNEADGDVDSDNS